MFIYLVNEVSLLYSMFIGCQEVCEKIGLVLFDRVERMDSKIIPGNKNWASF